MTGPWSIALDDAQVATWIDGIEARAADMSPAMAEISEYMLGQIEDRFARQVSPAGVPWRKSRRVEKGGGETLTLSARLRRSMRANHGRDFAEAGPEAGGAASVYAEAHQTGVPGTVIVPFHTRTVKSLFGRRLKAPAEQLVSSHMRTMTLPARPYLGFSDADGEEMKDIIALFLVPPAPVSGATS